MWEGLTALLPEQLGTLRLLMGSQSELPYCSSSGSTPAAFEAQNILGTSLHMPTSPSRGFTIATVTVGSIASPVHRLRKLVMISRRPFLSGFVVNGSHIFGRQA